MGFIVQWDAMAERFQRQRAIHCSTVQIQISEHRSHAPRHAALTRSSRAVNGDGESRHAFGRGGKSFQFSVFSFKYPEEEAPISVRVMLNRSPTCSALLAVNCQL